MFKINTNKINIPFIETHITDSCNLKCNRCTHFCHLIDDEIFVDVNEFEKDLSLLSNKCNLYQLRLLGGEPLLHPQINELIEISRKYFPKTLISITTNGLLLKSMKNDFWETMRKNHIMIDVSKYPILGNSFSELLDLIDNNNINIGQLFLKQKFHDKFNPKGNSDKEKSFNLCGGAKVLTLFQHRLYPCIGCYRYYYNKINNTNIPLPPSIDINEVSVKDIEKFIKQTRTPFEACQYCDDSGRLIKWELYKK